MPIDVPITLPRLTHEEMRDIDYQVMAHAFAAHTESQSTQGYALGQHESSRGPLRDVAQAGSVTLDGQEDFRARKLGGRWGEVI